MGVAGAARGRIVRALGGRSPFDLVLFAWLWWGFDRINNLGGTVRQSLSERHGHDILDVERALHLDPELRLNTWLAAHHAVRDVVAFYYEHGHGFVTFIVLAVLWWRRSPSLPALRDAIIGASLAAQAIFWAWPVAPPRMLAGPSFVDISDIVRGGAGWRHGASALYPDQLSSFPSLHVGWAVWSSVAIWRMTTWRRLRALAVLHPFATTYAVMATGNHYLADGVVGAAFMAVGVLGADRLARRRAPA